MNIEFNWAGKKRTVVFDGQSYIPQRAATGINKKTGEPATTVRDDGYYRSLGLAVKRIIDAEFGDSKETTTLLNYIHRYEAAVAEIKQLLPDHDF